VRPPGVFAALHAATLLCLVAPAVADTSDRQSATELLTDTREARNAKDFESAEELAREGEERFDDPVWPITLALILADQGKSAEALAVLAAPREGELPRVDLLMAEGYANQRGGDSWAALLAYGEVLLAQPDNAEAKDAVAAIMAKLRAAHGAEAIAGTNPQREADRAAALVRWGRTLQGADPATRYVATDKALALLDSLIAEARAAQPVDEARIRRLRIDRLIALRNRNRMTEVIAEVESLFPTEPPPTYVTEALADALLYERRPDEAIVAYEAVLKAEPNNLNAQYGRVFALVEAERQDEAVAAIDAIAAGQAVYQAYPGVPSAYLNLEKSYADMLAADVRLWANDIDEGYARLEAMAHAAPANPLIRRSLVAAMRQRGWLRQAEEDAAIAATLRPGTLPTQIMQANTELSRYRLNQAQAAVDRLKATAPDDLSVQRLADDVTAARGWLIEADMGPTWTRGGGTNAAGKEWTSSLRAESPWIAQGLRLMALTDSGIAHPVEGTVSRHRAGGGFAYQRSDLAATLYGTSSWGTYAGSGAGFSLDWQANDQLAFGVAGETFSRQTPLRALFYGITADSLAATFTWRRDEATSISVGTDWLSFSDGNNSLSSSIVGEQLLWAAAHIDVTGRAGLWYAQNSQQDGPYFSPESIISGTAGITVRQTPWRRYEQVFTHALSVEFGVQDQSELSSHGIGVLSYEQRWRTDPWWEIYYSAQFAHRVYDGDPERGIGLRFGFRRRL
jgi:biofilm PGA synthesis protein PgaA